MEAWKPLCVLPALTFDLWVDSEQQLFSTSRQVFLLFEKTENSAVRVCREDGGEMSRGRTSDDLGLMEPKEPNLTARLLISEHSTLQTGNKKRPVTSLCPPCTVHAPD